MRRFADRVRGLRHNEVFVGMDANFEVGAPQTTQGIAGRAIPQVAATTSTSRDIVAGFIQQISPEKLGHQHVRSMLAEAFCPHTRYPKGKLFGYHTAGSLDLLTMDLDTAAHITMSFTTAEVATKTDHSVLTKALLSPRMQVSGKKARKLYIGRHLQNLEGYNNDIADSLEKRVVLPPCASLRCGPNIQAMGAHRHGETPLRDARRACPGPHVVGGTCRRSPRERACARRACTSSYEGEGRGMAHLNKQHADMPLLHKAPGERITCTEQISEEAQSYCSISFARSGRGLWARLYSSSSDCRKHRSRTYTTRMSPSAQKIAAGPWSLCSP